jgi:hypothetical protein
MEGDVELERVTCPACGGAGGGPFGRAGSAWDDEDYICPRCKGIGVIAVDLQSARPGIVKAGADTVVAPAAEKARKASA